MSIIYIPESYHMGIKEFGIVKQYCSDGTIEITGLIDDAIDDVSKLTRAKIRSDCVRFITLDKHPLSSIIETVTLKRVYGFHENDIKAGTLLEVIGVETTALLAGKHCYQIGQIVLARSGPKSMPNGTIVRTVGSAIKNDVTTQSLSVKDVRLLELDSEVSSSENNFKGGVL